MLGPADALGIARDLANVRLYATFGELGHRVGYRMQSDISIDAVDARLASRLPSMPARPTPIGAREAARFVEAAIAEASKLVAPDSFAERALAVGLAYADVVVLGRIADYHGLVLAIEKKPDSPRRDRVIETMPLLASARETCVNALDRFIQGIEHEDLAPDVLEAATELRKRIAGHPPRFDTEEAGHQWRPGETWWKGLESAMVNVAIALGVPPTDAPKANAIRRLGAEAVTVKNGVVDELVIAADRYILEWRAIRSTASVRRVRVTGVKPLLDALLASGALADTLWIDLLGEGLDDADIAKIASAPDLASVRALGLDRNRISDNGVRTIWASPILAPLRYCGLNGNPCSELAFQELTREEMSRYEWLPTAHASALAAELGSRWWPVPSDYGWPPTLDDLARPSSS